MKKSLRRIKMTVSRLIDELGLEVLSLPFPDREIKGGYTGDLLSWVMGRAKADNVWITIMTNINVVAVASLSDVAAVVIAENAEIDVGVIKKAEEQGINVLRSKCPAYETAIAVGKLI